MTASAATGGETARAPFDAILLGPEASPAVRATPASTVPSGDRLGALLLADAATSTTQGPRFPAPNPTTLLLLLVQLDDLTLSDGMAAYGSPEDPLLPVGELSRLLELDIDVSPTEGRVTGSIGQARRALVIDLATNTARIGPQSVTLAAGDIAVEPAEIYVRASVLTKLLPLRVSVDPRALQMRITALELLPIEGRLQRLARIRQASPGRAGAPVLRANEPYHLFTPPSFDVALGLGLQTNSPKFPTRYDIRMGGDLLNAGLQAYVGSDDTGRASTARVLLERRSLDGDLLGPLHAHVLGVGDVFTPGLAIGPRSLAGRGIQLSTAPLDQTTIFNRVDLRGDLPLGSDVELYINDVLQGTQAQATRGQYEFLNVPLTRGINVVRIVTYGPRGQRSEETRIINAGGGLLRRGQTSFDFAAVEQDVPLVRVRDFDPLQADPSYGRRRIVANVGYGLTQYLTATAGGALYSDHLGVERQLGTFGLRTSIAGFATQADIAADDRGGGGAQLSVAGRLFGANALLRHAEYHGGLLDENNAEANVDRAVRRRTELTVDDNLAFGTKVAPFSLRALRDLYVDGGSAWIGQARASASFGGFLYSTGVEVDRFTSPNGLSSDRTRGYVSASTFKSYEWQFRTTLDYDASPRARLTDVSVSLDQSLNNRWSLRFGATERFDTPKGLELIAGSTTRTKFGDLAVTGQYDTNNSTWRLGAQLNFGVGYNPATHAYELTRPGPGSGGSILFHAFMDANGDGKFDPGERPVSGVMLESGLQQARTGPDGRAYLSGLGAASTARVQVDLSGLENSAVKTPPTIIELTPHPGGVTVVEYPVRPTGEVMINLKLRRPDGQSVGLSATRVRVVDQRGVATEGVTEFDGSVSFQDLPAGDYRMELDADQATRLRMRLTDPVRFTIRPDGSLTPDVTGQVEFTPRPDDRPPG